MLFIAILLVFAIRYLRKVLPPKALSRNWDFYLLAGNVAAITFFVAYFIFNQLDLLFALLCYIMVGILIYRVFVIPEWRIARPMTYSILPLAIAMMAADITQAFAFSFYESAKMYFDIAFAFGVVWAFILGIIFRNQNKALETEKQKLEEKEREIAASEKVKAMLEGQVAERTTELTRQKEELQKALEELKAAQTQLIHAEKMASLGELTAGIAHEIQNPLNFVNNFSDVSKELLDEMKEAMEKGETEEAKKIMQDVIDNLEKINHHGKRADAIVKGMLQHSRTSTGQKELTDINALCDEYLRLAYHGLRAKDKSFNSKYKTEFDESIPKLNIVPQDIGRVILNMLNNAFYAVSERSKAEKAAVNEKMKTSGENYEPSVILQTKNLKNEVEISITDNGNGIPENIREKIFQPFFTTKPTGKGTGLGLSLSYDIIKAHGGEISINSVPGESTTFKITLPYN